MKKRDLFKFIHGPHIEYQEIIRYNQTEFVCLLQSDLPMALKNIFVKGKAYLNLFIFYEYVKIYNITICNIYTYSRLLTKSKDISKLITLPFLAQVRMNVR